MKWLAENFKGILISLVIAMAAVFLGNIFPIVGGPVFGILLGILFGNIIGRPDGTAHGVRFASKNILQWAIIALGGGLSLKQVYVTGMSSLYVMMFTLSAAFLTAFILGRLMKIPLKLTSLIAVGTAICGGSAIAAISPIIEAEDRDIAYAISTVFMFNIIAVILFPALGHLMGLSQRGFGLWAGTAINDTSSVVAAAYSYGNDAGAYATIVKLTRTTMIIPISLIFAAVTFINREKQSEEKHVHYSFVKIFPWFILWFLAASLLNTTGIIDARAAHIFTETGKFMIVLALSAIGLHTDFKKMVETGYRPMVLGFIAWVVVAVTSLLVQKFTGQL
jgi:uncharacterized integral membrane protein (TIGR00698 family)